MEENRARWGPSLFPAFTVRLIRPMGRILLLSRRLIRRKARIWICDKKRVQRISVWSWFEKNRLCLALKLTFGD